MTVLALAIVGLLLPRPQRNSALGGQKHRTVHHWRARHAPRVHFGYYWYRWGWRWGGTRYSWYGSSFAWE